jgi:hypothetical protein
MSRPEENDPGALLTVVVLAPVALVLVFLWPAVFVALVLLLVAITPFAASVAGVRAILAQGRRAAR